MGLSNVPKAPKPKFKAPKMPKVSVGTTRPDDLRHLKKKPEALVKAQEKKAKSDAKTLAKLPKAKKAKKNMGEGDVYEVKGKAPKAKSGKLRKGTPEYKKELARLTDIDMGPTKEELSKIKPSKPHESNKLKKVAKKNKPRGGGAGENVVDI